jgi:hypothetical protein
MSFILALVMVITVAAGVSALDAATVSYNLGSFEVEVPAEKFNDGHYVIQLEDNAFFPYEVQFRVNDTTQEKWFMTPESVLEVGGYTFGVYSEQTDDTLFRQIGFWIEGEYFPAYPEPKEFTHSLFMPLSLFPLPQFNVSLNLESFNHLQLREVEVSYMLNNFVAADLPPAGEGKAVWMNTTPAEQSVSTIYSRIMEQGEKVDMSSITTLRLIVGSALQLDPDNVRVVVTVNRGGAFNVVNNFYVHTEDEGVRSEALGVNRSGQIARIMPDGFVYSDRSNTLNITADAPTEDYYIGFTINPSYADMPEVADIKVYIITDTYEIGDNITNIILDKDMTQIGAGFKHSPVITWGMINTLSFLINFYDAGGGLVTQHYEYLNITRSAPAGFAVQSVDIRYENEAGERIDAVSFLTSVFASTPLPSTTVTRTESRFSRSWLIPHRFIYTVPMQDYFMGFVLRSDFEDYDVDVIRGNYTSLEAAVDALEADPTLKEANLLGQNMSETDTGVKFTPPTEWRVTQPVDYSLIFYASDGTPMGVYVEQLSFSRTVRTSVTNPTQMMVPEIEFYTKDEAGDRVPVENFWEGWQQTEQTTAFNRRSLRMGSAFEIDFDAEPRDYYLSFTLNETLDNYKAVVLRGNFLTPAAAEAALAANPQLNITEYILNNDDMTAEGAGFTLNLLEPHEFYREEYISILFYNENDELLGLHTEGFEFYRMTHGFYYELYDGEDFVGDYDTYHYFDYDEESPHDVTFVLNMGVLLKPEYTLRMTYIRNFMWDIENREHIGLVVTGHEFDTLEEALAAVADAERADVTDIKDLLFPDYDEEAGFTADFRGEGQTFTVFADGEVYRISVRVAVRTAVVPNMTHIPRPYQDDIYFRVNGALIDGEPGDDWEEGDKIEDKELDVYVMPFWADAYYDRGFQTVFVNCKDVDINNIRPTFSLHGSGTTAFAPPKGSPGLSAVEQTSGETWQGFASAPVHYTATQGARGKNYWVTFVQKTEEPKLFVNGINGPACETENCKCGNGVQYCRVVFLDALHDSRHDIFVANIGEKELTGLNVTLTDAQNVRLDPYWTFGGENNDTLAGFTETSEEGVGELWNVGMIRLLPPLEGEMAGDGRVSGTLTITHKDLDKPIVINLTGIAGDPRIVTEEAKDGVMFVPYSTVLQTNNMYEWSNQSWHLIVPDKDDDDDDDKDSADSAVMPLSASLGVEIYPGSNLFLRPSGEIYGMPMEEGTYTFEVEARFTGITIRNGTGTGSISHTISFRPSRLEFTIEIEKNTDANVNEQNNYDIISRVPDMNRFQDRDFHVSAEFDTWAEKFFFNGVELIEGEDYTADEGSTRITIFGLTFENNSTSGTNTIAAEFRDGSGTGLNMSKAAQNFNLTSSGGSGGGRPGGGGGGSSDPAGGAGVQTQTLVIQPGTGIWVLANIPRTSLTALGLSIDIPVIQIRIPAGQTGGRTLSIGAEYAGHNVIIVKFNTNTNQLEFVSAAIVGEDGNASVNIGQVGDFLALTFKTGDITGTGEVNTADALALLRHIAGIAELNSIQLFVANGKEGDINTADALNILRYIAGVIEKI